MAGLPVWGKDIGNSDFIDRMSLVGANVDKEWPRLRDQQILDDLFDEIISGQDKEIDYLTLRLAVYVKCLEFLSRFQDKRCQRHCIALKKVLDVEEHSRDILSVIWNVFQRMQPFQGRSIIEEWRLVALAFVGALFNLQHEPSCLSQDFFKKLCLISYAPAIATHCWLFSPPVSRMRGTVVRKLMYQAASVQGLSASLKYYYQTELGEENSVRQVDALFNSSDDDDDSVLEAVRDFDAYMTEYAPKTMWDSVLSRYLAVLNNAVADSGNEVSYGRLLDRFENPNFVIEKYLHKNFHPPMQVIEDIILRCPGATLISAAAFLAAKTWHVNPIMVDQILLVSLIIDHLGPPKLWTDTEKHLSTILASNMKPFWLPTLRSLRTLEDSLPSYTVSLDSAISVILRQWAIFGGVMGVVRLVDDGMVVVCYDPLCELFLRGRDKKRKIRTGVCTGCRKVQYCSLVCQQRDWRQHKVWCKK